jgi:peptidoglycan hydrolase-like protein with peptidoglycan-binding domain
MYGSIGGYGDISGGQNVPGLGYYYWRESLPGPRRAGTWHPVRSFYPHRAGYWFGINGLGAALEPGPTPTIKRGSKGEPVQRWQKFLGVTADGDFGPGTEKATKTWQGANELTADGVVGPASWAKAAILSAPAAAPSTTFAPGSGGTIGQQIKIGPGIMAMIAKPSGAATTGAAAGGGWWSRQSTMTKVAIGVGGVAVVGGLAYMLLGKKTRSATPNPGRRRRRRKSPWCAAAVRACDGPMLKRRAS